MMTEALHPFSWKYSEMLNVSPQQLSQHDGLASCSPLQLASVQLVLQTDDMEAHALRQTVPLLSRIRPGYLHSCSFAYTGPGYNGWGAVAELMRDARFSTSIQTLSFSRVKSAISQDVIDAISGLPLLQRCKLPFTGYYSQRPPNLMHSRQPLMLFHNLIQTAMHFYPREHWWFQQDNAPQHTSHLPRRWFHNHGVDLLDFPPYSPDLNPIENLWSILKARIEARLARTTDEIERILKEEWEALDKELLTSLAHSMPTRCAAVIANHGHKAPY